MRLSASISCSNWICRGITLSISALDICTDQDGQLGTYFWAFGEVT